MDLLEADFTAGKRRYKSRRFRGSHQVSMIFQKREHTGSWIVKLGAFCLRLIEYAY